jgi:hypothetical protein
MNAVPVELSIAISSGPGTLGTLIQAQFEWAVRVLNSPASFMIFRMKTAIPIKTTANIMNIFFFIGSLLRDYSEILKQGSERRRPGCREPIQKREKPYGYC